VADGGLAGFATILHKTGSKLVSRYCNRYGRVWRGKNGGIKSGSRTE